MRKERSFTKFYNDTFDYLLTLNLTASRWKLMLVIIRHTYGWGSESCSMTYDELARRTGYSKRQVMRDIKYLSEEKLIIKEINKKNTMFLRFNESLLMDY